MIDFYNEIDFEIENREEIIDWIKRVVGSEGFDVGELVYIFCDDVYLLEINQKYLNHDTYTDIITFDYSDGKVIGGDIFISVDRVRENSKVFGVSFYNELLRVLAHGALHLMGYKDKLDDDAVIMRSKEDEKIKMFHVEQ